MTYNETILQKAQPWLAPPFDEETQAKVKAMMETNPDAFNEAFYTDLEFGTGGLRGVMGVGTNRLNKYTVGLATQGFANYLKGLFRIKHRQLQLPMILETAVLSFQKMRQMC